MKNRIRVLRAEREITQETLAAALGVTRQTIIAIEKGKYDPSLPLALRIARFFQTPVETIFLDDEAAQPAP
jgi:putative transcriptional regulator